MNNETVSIYASLYSQIASDSITNARTSLAALSLLFYAFFLHFSDEVRYIWKPKLTLSTFLYLLAQYSALLLLIIQSIQTILPPSLDSLRVCNGIGILGDALSACGYIGVQGLISLRAYSVCQGYHPMAITLSILFLIPLSLQIYVITTPKCTDISFSISSIILSFIRDIAVGLSDVLAFISILHQVWRIRKLKRSVGLRSNGKDLITSLLQQGLLRFLFVLFISNITAILGLVQSPNATSGIFISFQNVLSCIMMCEFTIALRRRNMKRAIPNHWSALNLATLSLPSQDDQVQTHQSIIERIHESLVAEMAERSDPAVIDNLHDVEVDDLQDANPTTSI